MIKHEFIYIRVSSLLPNGHTSSNESAQYSISASFKNHTHSYTYSYTSVSSSQHKSFCACGAFNNKSAHDFGPYLSYSASLHKKTCDCGYYIAESHTLVRLNLKLYGCTSCTYTRLITDEEMVHLGIDEETEGDLS